MASISPSQTFLNVVNTNYIPLPHEAEQLRTAITVEKGHVSILDEEIDQLRRRLNDLESRKAVHTKTIEEYSALLSPARALPPEILGKIFLACLDDYIDDSPSSEWQYHPAYLLSQVCRSWREFSIGYPRLWSAIDIWLPIHPNRVFHKCYKMAVKALPDDLKMSWCQSVSGWFKRMRSIDEMLKLSLTRSANMALTISFGEKGVHLSPDCSSGCPMGPIVDTLLSAYTRLEDVAFKFKIEHPACRLKDLLSVNYHDVPSLCTAQLDIKLGRMAEEGAALSPLLNLKGPHLKAIYLDMRWHFVRILSDGIDWSVLTDLRLCTLGRDDILTPDLTSVMETLRKCPRLVRCALELEHEDYTTLPDHQAPEYPISLRHLRELTIFGYGVHLFLSRALELPALEGIHTPKTRRNPYNGEEEEIPDGILPWARKYGSQLKHVSFEYESLSQRQLMLTVTRLVAVVSLTVSGIVDYEEVGLEHDVDERVYNRWDPPARLDGHTLKNVDMLLPQVAEVRVHDGGFGF